MAKGKGGKLKGESAMQAVPESAAHHQARCLIL